MSTVEKAKKPLTEAQFHRLPEVTRRKRIAKDVIATLALSERKRYRVARGTYLMARAADNRNLFKLTKGEDGEKGVDPTTSLHEALPRLEKHCTVCAKGALLIAHVRLFNQVEVGDTESHFFNMEDSEICDALEPYFPENNLDMIERAFEGAGNGAKWEVMFPDPEERLRAICRNVVKDKEGLFRIEALPHRPGPDPLPEE